MLSIPMDALAGMIELATIDDVAYLRLDLIVRLDRDADVPTYYCCAHDWPASEVARLVEARRHAADLEATNAKLAARLVELERQLAATQATPPPLAPTLTCPDCGRTDLRTEHALVVHRGRAHGVRSPRQRKASPAVPDAAQNGHTTAEEGADAAPLA